MGGQAGEVGGPAGEVGGPAGEVGGPAGEVGGPIGEVDGPIGEVGGPAGEVGDPAGYAGGPDGRGRWPAGEVGGPTGEVDDTDRRGGWSTGPDRRGGWSGLALSVCLEACLYFITIYLIFFFFANLSIGRIWTALLRYVCHIKSTLYTHIIYTSLICLLLIGFADQSWMNGNII